MTLWRFKRVRNGSLYRYWKRSVSDHFYTTNAAEIGTTIAGQVGQHGYSSEGVACYVIPYYGWIINVCSSTQTMYILHQKLRYHILTCTHCQQQIIFNNITQWLLLIFRQFCLRCDYNVTVSSLSQYVIMISKCDVICTRPCYGRSL